MDAGSTLRRTLFAISAGREDPSLRRPAEHGIRGRACPLDLDVQVRLDLSSELPPDGHAFVIIALGDLPVPAEEVAVTPDAADRALGDDWLHDTRTAVPSAIVFESTDILLNSPRGGRAGGDYRPADRRLRLPVFWRRGLAIAGLLDSPEQALTPSNSTRINRCLTEDRCHRVPRPWVRSRMISRWTAPCRNVRSGAATAIPTTRRTGRSSRGLPWYVGQ